MKLAVLTDIHSNYHGLKACLDYLEKEQPDHYLFLGDYVSDCALPRQTMDLVYETMDRHPCTLIRGNREEYLMDHADGAADGWFSPSSGSGSLLFTYRNLRQADLDFFRTLEDKGILELPGMEPVGYCHGSMEGTRSFLIQNHTLSKDTADALPADLVISGHTHVQGLYENHGKRVVTAGSVGVPWNHNGKSQFVILHGIDGHWEVELKQIEYDRKNAIDSLYETGLMKEAPIWAKIVEHTLLTGVDYSMDCLKRAMELRKIAEGQDAWGSMPEKYWEQAAKELNLIK